jgi:hypothetical protein
MHAVHETVQTRHASSCAARVSNRVAPVRAREHEMSSNQDRRQCLHMCATEALSHSAHRWAQANEGASQIYARQILARYLLIFIAVPFDNVLRTLLPVCPAGSSTEARGKQGPETNQAGQGLCRERARTRNETPLIVAYKSEREL